ncbi:hypothetical protein [Cytobacillus praedii]|uniref:Uncharacterized protein n=1 Tax=Cytobacillus praedii TaxID=1742358 RepID=A0A4R1AVL9_9BACI|nr:hypothetical protein [Cytobacillus praedii]TCJ04425.1 hypothetical protein E0Y62_10030 [Cytobacillus praedii]
MEEENIKFLDTETDPLTSFMFGKHKYNRNSDEINELIHKESREFDEPSLKKRERDWLFGVKEDRIDEKKQDLGALTFINRIDIGELIENIEILINSTDQLKPLYKKATPLISQFLKKS